MNFNHRKLWGYLKSGPALNLWAGYFAFASVAAYGICSLPIAVRFLNKEELGLWNLISQVVSYLIFLELGVGASSGRTLAEPLASGNQDEIDKAWSSVIVLLAIMGTAVSLVGTGLYAFVLSYFRIPQRLLADAAFVYVGSVLVNALSLPLRAVTGVLLCQERYYWSLIIQGVLPWINFVSFAAFLFMGLGMRSYVFSSLIVVLSQYLWYRYLLATGAHKIRLRPSLVSWHTVRPILGYSTSMMLWSIAPAVLSSIPSFVLARHASLEQISIYNVTSRIPTMMGSLALRMYHAFYPKIQGLYVSGKRGRFLPLYRLATSSCLWLTGLSLTAAVILNPVLVSILAKPDFYGGTWMSLVFVFGLLLLAIGEHLGNLFILAGKPRLISLVLAIEVGVAFLAATLACPRFGSLGVAMCIAMAPLVCRIPYYAIVGPRTCGMTLVTLYRPAFLTTVCLVLTAVTAISFTRHAGVTQNVIVAVPLLIAAVAAGFYSIKSMLEDFRLWKSPQETADTAGAAPSPTS